MVNRVWRRGRGHPPRRQLINLPLIYFEVEDVRPDENEGQDVDENEGQENSSSVLNSGGVSVPGELVQGILRFLTGKELLRFAGASKATFQVVARCKALRFDAIRERIDNLVDSLSDRGRRQANLRRFKEKNRVRVKENDVRVDAYCVRVTPKYVYTFVRRTFLRRFLKLGGRKVSVVCHMCVGRVNTHLSVMGINHHSVAEDRPRFYVPGRAAVAHEQQEDIPGKDVVND